MSHENLIRELDFILTHPKRSVQNLESFYNSCLFIYETVPLLVILDHIGRKDPKLLVEWSQVNELISKVIDSDMEEIKNFGYEHIKAESIEIKTSLSQMRPAGNGYLRYIWSTTVDEKLIDRCFKNKSIKVVCNSIGDLELVGLRKADDDNYNLYLKIREDKK